jgi:molybdopterin-guanine dinucleotide biosynthesis protein B
MSTPRSRWFEGAGLKVLGIAGWSGAGKTTLLTALVPCLRALGVRISTIKQAHHGLEFDQPGKDSHRHRQAGAEETILANAAGFALFGAAPPPPGLEALLARLAPVDLVLVEGFRTHPFAKLEIYRPALGKPPLWPKLPVIAVASDAALPDCQAPVLNLNAPARIADFVAQWLGLVSRS